MQIFLRRCFSVVWRRGLVVAMLNWMFFGLIAVGGLLGQFGAYQVFVWPFGEIFPLEADNAIVVTLSIFLFNLVLSCFILVTLSGLVFFGLPLFFLSFRALLWGMLLSGLSTPLFLAVLPTLMLEGEGYVLGALAGVNLGLSWLRPGLVYRGEKLSRSEAVRRAFRDCLRIYVLVALFLLVAAVVETATIVLI